MADATKEIGNDEVKDIAAQVTGEPEKVLDDEGEAPMEYDPEAFAAETEAAEKALAAQGRLVENPAGTDGMSDPIREGRAEAMRSDPLARLTAVQRAQYEKFGTLPPGVGQPQQQPNQLAALTQALTQVLAAAAGQNVDALGSIGVPDPELDTVEMIGDFILVSTWGGRTTVQKFQNLQYLQGFVQKAPGTKRIFREIPGQSEMQEINGQGHPIVR
jgi:hypothetical protein